MTSENVSCGYEKDKERFGSHHGNLNFYQEKPSYGQCPRSFDVSSDGSWMAIGNRISSTVTILMRDSVFKGALGDVVAQTPVDRR